MTIVSWSFQQRFVLLGLNRRVNCRAHHGITSVRSVAVLLGLMLLTPRMYALPPRYDHVVIVVEENRTLGQIIGDTVNAPYINFLAKGGVRMNSMFAIQHPSQPNYLHLFSGSNQDVLDDNLPTVFSITGTAKYPFRSPNLGAELIAAGFSFAGFSEELETAGNTDWADYDPHTATRPGIYYRRKHNPWANWVAKVLPTPSNQLPKSVNRSFSQFPTNFSELPTVSFVIPNQLHDMHDGSRKQGDDWIRENLQDYAAWSKSNNSLLIITWDEDDYKEDNQIPTVLYGANLRDGTAVNGAWTLHNLLRTLEEMYGSVAHAGSAAQVRPIVGPFRTDPPILVATFRQGLAGYTGAHDTQLSQDFPDLSMATAEELNADLDASSSPGAQQSQVLIRFENLFGAKKGQVPTNAVIHSAKLLMHTPKNTTSSDFDSKDLFGLHRMLIDWDATNTWSGLNGGVSADGTEAVSNASFSAVPNVDGAPSLLDVSSDIELYRSGVPNHGWTIRASSTGTGDGWTFTSSDNAKEPNFRPSLEIVYSLPVTPYEAWVSSHGLMSADREPLADPDQDGVNNLSEFAYNLNPLRADTHDALPPATNGLPVGLFTSIEGETSFQVQYVRRQNPSMVGLEYSVAFSPDLIHWTLEQVAETEPVDSSWERVKVRPTSIPAGNALFCRILLTLQP